MRDPGEGQLLLLAVAGSSLCLPKDLVYPIAKGLLRAQSHPLELRITACNYLSSRAQKLSVGVGFLLGERIFPGLASRPLERGQRVTPPPAAELDQLAALPKQGFPKQKPSAPVTISRALALCRLSPVLPTAKPVSSHQHWLTGRGVGTSSNSS